MPITEQEIIKIVEDSGYKYLENEYREKNNRKRRFVHVQCDKGHESYWTRLDVFKNGHRCEKCKNENYKGKWDKNKIIKYVEDNDYIFIDFIKFDKGNSRIKLQCPKGHEYEVTFRKFLEGIRCPICKESKGERKISEVLNKYNIEYIPQYKFDDCKFKNRLPFDFYLSKYNCCIEFDGLQHEVISGRSKDKDKNFDDFVSTKIRDSIKNIYCRNNNIKLIRIPYKEMNNIENILIKELKLK